MVKNFLALTLLSVGTPMLLIDDEVRRVLSRRDSQSPFNAQSSCDRNWATSYGGVDDPVRRKDYEPADFRPVENPFYVALPY
ncbi:MAG: hypothetical protein JO334_09865 [Verrucomicrobia bacterium]|nr:hypothetical protein [Verrucomicrobiota bacterium]